ncbi:uncharacterized protein K02A2.6-like [Dendronephthya gigantea]|uniref:uncharacterized protein K02A2.6-like n=1 Tax=Dendronephthya gigantea TaxID=151771 RepID=UPI00106BA801|nr:uncharacterized protein K02A2.6-like [Dendronephthya gigantea]
MDEEGQAAQPNVGFNLSFMGHMEEYSSNNDWKQYVERLEIFFEVNNVPTEKQASSILTLMGSKMYALLRSITAPRRPKELTYQEIVETLTQHLEPKPIVIAERYKFHKAEQEQSESIRDYLAKLQRLAETCEFGGYRDEAIRDRFVCGLRNRVIQSKLLGEAELTLKLAVEKACTAELTDRETSALHGESLHRLETVFPECFRCGKKNHVPDKCFFRKSKCHGCQNYGHIIKKCPERSGNNNWKKIRSGKSKGKDDKRKKKKPSGIHNVKTDSDVESDCESQEEVMDTTWPVFMLTDSGRKQTELKVLVSIEGKPVTMEVDTGAAVSIMPESVWRKLSSTKPVRKSNVKLRSYSGHEIPVLGEIDVGVVYGNQKAHLPVIVTNNEGPVLLGRNWLSVLKLNWSQIKKVSVKRVNNVEQLTSQYSSLFDDSLGTVKGVKAHLKMKPNATPKFFKPRPVPFALKDKIGEELNRLEELGVLKKVEFSEWATPIVPVLKPDGSVRICGDYKVTINPCLDVQEYPMPTAEELFTKLNGGEKFSKIDLSAAYQQVLLDDESKP